MRTRQRVSGRTGTGGQKEISSSMELSLGRPGRVPRQAMLGLLVSVQGLLLLLAQSPSLLVPSTAGVDPVADYISIY